MPYVPLWIDFLQRWLFFTLFGAVCELLHTHGRGRRTERLVWVGRMSILARLGEGVCKL